MREPHTHGGQGSPGERDGHWGDAGGLPVADRPLAPASGTDRETPVGVGYRAAFLRSHEWLRYELGQIRRVAADVVAGKLEPEDARVAVRNLAMAQHRWNLMEFCGAYCQILENHHLREDREMFAALLGVEPRLKDVVARLKAEHDVIAAVLVRFDRALVRALREVAETVSEVAAIADELSALLLSHLAYEEDQLHHGLGLVELPY